MPQRPAKITCPRPSGAVARPRLFAKLDAVRKGAAAWVSGPPGSGKTTLVASWLAARKLRPAWLRVDALDADPASFFHYLAAAAAPACRGALQFPVLAPGLELEAFARNFFRGLLAHVRPGTVLVLDDLGELPPDAPLLGALRVLVEELPRGTGAVLIARGEPPRALEGVRGSRLGIVGARDLQLTPAESRAIARRHGFEADGAGHEALHRSAHGWAAGLVLLLARERFREGPVDDREAAFDYFAGEVLDRVDPRTRTVLLEIALLDAPTASLTAYATGNPSAPRVLAALADRGLFTVRHPGDDPVYELHALLRAFLLARGRAELAPGRADAVRRAAAEALAARGGAQVEAAFALFVDAGAFDDAARLAVREARALLAAGRAAVLEAWTARIPRAYQESDPWLLYFAATASLMRDPGGARARMERAHALFVARGEAAGVWLSWAGAVDATLVSWTDLSPLSRRIDELEALRGRFEIPSPEVGARVTLAELAALVHHAPGHAALRDSYANARTLALAPGDARTRLLAGAQLFLCAGWWLGDLAGARPILEALRATARAPSADPVAATLWLSLEALFHHQTGDEPAAARAIDEGFAIAGRYGVRAWDGFRLTPGIWSAFQRDDLAAARAGVERIAASSRPENPIDVSYLRVFEALTALRGGAFRDATRFATEAKALAERTSYAVVHVFVDLLLARAHACSGPDHAGEAEAALASAREKIGRIATPPFEHLLALVEADVASRGGDLDRAAAALARAVAGATAGAGHARYLFSRDGLAGLWALALRRGVAPDAVRAIVRGAGLPPPGDAGEEWPWPLSIRALGAFEIFRDGAPLAPGARASRKPLELLRVLVAHGGRDVDEGAIADALWPDAEADAAHHALETTVYRLRRIVGQDVVAQGDGKLSLADDRCWLDARELERRLSSSAPTPSASDVARVASLYRGPFLEDAGEAPWAAAARDRIRRKLSRWIDALESDPKSRGEAGVLRATIASRDAALGPAPLRRLA